MSVYVAIDGGEPEFVASNIGWGKLSAWLATQDAPNANHLTAHGWDEPAGQLRDELVGLPTPDAPEVASTLAELVAALAGVPDDAAVVVTNGAGAVGNDEDDDAGHPALDAIGDAVLESLGLPTSGRKHKDAGGHGSEPRGGGEPSESADASSVASHPAVKSATDRLAERASQLAATVRTHLASIDPADILDTADDWGRIFAARHADPVAAHLGVGSHTAALILSHLAAHAVSLVRGRLVKGTAGK